MPEDFFNVNFGSEDNKPVDFKKTPQTEAKKKIERAKEEALKEIDAFNKAYENFKKEIDGLVLYEEIIPQTEKAIKVLFDSVITPAVFGKPIPGMPDFIFAQLRKDIFKKLIEKQKEE